MSDSTTPQDGKAMSPASAGSVAGEPVAWAVMCDGYVRSFFQTQEFAKSGIDSLRRTRRETLRIVPLYRQPQDGVVRLPPLDPNGAPGWNAAIGAARQALADAGVDWDTE